MDNEASMKLYIAGPMTGLPEYNYPAFFEAEDQLRAAGYDVANPAMLGVRDGWEWADYMRAGLRMLLNCDGIAMLDGWHASRGAQVELRLALSLDMPEGSVAAWLNRADTEAVAP